MRCKFKLQSRETFIQFQALLSKYENSGVSDGMLCGLYIHTYICDGYSVIRLSLAVISPMPIHCDVLFHSVVSLYNISKHDNNHIVFILV